MNKIPVVSNNHNVYILGAGFCKDAGLPLSQNFMVKMREAYADLVANFSGSHEIDHIGRVLQFRQQSTSSAYRVPLDIDNVEQLFSLAATYSGQLGIELERAMRHSIAETIEYCRRTHIYQPSEFIAVTNALDRTVLPKTWVPRDFNDGYANTVLRCPLYDYYAALLAGKFHRDPNQRDTVVTFNYDTVLEDALHNLSVPFSYGLETIEKKSKDNAVDLDESARCISSPSSVSHINVLKLHGSVNWGLNDPHRNNMRIFGTYQNLLEKVYEPILIPPSWRKGWGPGHPINSVWDSAIKEIETATRIIIVGYSIPPTDLHLKYLLAVGLQNNISLQKVLVVNPTLDAGRDDIERDRTTLMGRLFGEEGLFHTRHLEQRIVQIYGMGARHFFCNRDTLVRIQRTPNHPNSTSNQARIIFQSNTPSMDVIY